MVFGPLLCFESDVETEAMLNFCTYIVLALLFCLEAPGVPSFEMNLCALLLCSHHALDTARVLLVFYRT